MIELRRPAGQFARVGHRGASALAPENTLRALELAVELGCDMLEFDVLDLIDGTLVLAHSNALREVSHGVARGTVRSRSLDALRRVAPDLPTLDEALAFCRERLPGIGLQVDLKRRGPEGGVVDALRRHDVLDRSWVSGFDVASLVVSPSWSPACRAPTPCLVTVSGSPSGVRSPRSCGAPSPQSALPCRGVFQCSSPGRVPPRRLCTTRSHRRLRSPVRTSWMRAVYVWTVDDSTLAERLVRDGADGIITNDPRIFATLKA